MQLAPCPRRSRSLRLAAAAAAALVVVLGGGSGRATEQGVQVLEGVRRRVERSFCFRDRLPQLWPAEVLDAARARVRAAPDPDADLVEINALLSQLKASHAELLPRPVYRQEYGAESRGEESVRFGLELAPREAPEGGTRWFVTEVLPQGAAAAAGLRRGDEVVAVDGLPPAASPRTVFFGDAGVPWPRHRLLRGEEPVVLSVRTVAAASPVEVHVSPTAASRLDASGDSVLVLARAGRRLGYLRLYHVLHPDAARILSDALSGPFAGVDGVILDLRGWGGRVDVLSRVLAALPGGRQAAFAGPLVALVDERTRSAKEVGAYELRGRGVPLVGRRTAGAVLGCDFFPVGSDHVLMLPVQEVNRLSDGVKLEGQGVAPTVVVADDLAFAGGRDAVLEAGVAVLLERIQASLPEPVAAPPAPAEPAREPALF